MTAITDATTVIETVIGRTLTGVQLRNVGQRFKDADPYSLIANGIFVFVDPENPTDEELAQFFMDCIWQGWKNMVAQSQRSTSTESKQSEIESEVAAAVADIE
jgi:hypothetical protein